MTWHDLVSNIALAIYRQSRMQFFSYVTADFKRGATTVRFTHISSRVRLGFNEILVRIARFHAQKKLIINFQLLFSYPIIH